MLFQYLDRLRFRDADRRTAIGQPIAINIAAVTTTGEEIHDVVTLHLRIVATQCKVAAGTRWSRKQAVWNRLSHGTEHRLHNALRHFRRTPRYRSWIFGVQHRSSRGLDVKGLKATRVDRHFGENVLHRNVYSGLRCCPDGIHRPPAWRA